MSPTTSATTSPATSKPPPGPRTLLCIAVAELLADAGVGEWNPDGVYGRNDTAITVAAVPADPTNIIALSLYVLNDDSGRGSSDGQDEQLDSTMALQVRYRSGADPRLVQDLADAGFAVLHDLTHLPFAAGAGEVLLCRRSYSAPLGADDEDRWQLADTYQLTVSRP